ncbi:AsmA family protein [Flavobacterium sp. RSB2_4_14]|uniref:AsmA family protein n=1 Tax=Flavobacterium sp. RSB2_4_14 TaxID=3447665 RepID=UPI003F31F3E6
MNEHSQSIITKTLKIIGITIVSILFLMFILPILFPEKISNEIKSFANTKLTGELDFKKVNLSFFNHFPSLTLTLTDFSLKGSSPYKKETLVSAKEVAFGINIKSLLFDKKINIDKIFVSDALINVKVNEKGEANYNVYLSEANVKEKDTTSNTALRLEKITIENTRLVYDDKSTKILIDAKGFNYVGKGDLNLAVFEIYTEAEIDSFSLNYDGQQYLKNKKVNADLITNINTNSLAFVFQQNNLKINKLPVQFNGKFDFLSNGYDMDFNIKSTDSKLNDFFTALPPSYITWLEKTKVEGKTDLSLTLKGKYIESENQKPDLAFNMKIRNGLINYSDAPFPVSNIFLNFDTKLPSLDTEKLLVNIDSVFFNVNKDFVKGIIKTEGLSTPKIDARINSKIDLAEMDKAFGLQNMDLRGVLNMDIKSKGIYDKKNGKIPVTDGSISFKNGYVKTDYYPNPIQSITVLANVIDKKGTLEDLNITIAPASFEFEGKPIYVNAKLKNFENINYDIKAKGELDIAKIYKVFSQKGLELEGYINADVAFKGSQNDAMNGRYNKLQNSGILKLRNIKTTSEYLPQPFIIKEGTFVFNQDKMNFNDFLASYGQSDFKMNGYLQNVIDFVLTNNAILKGNFTLHSDYINVDEFMYASSAKTPETPVSVDVKETKVNVEPATGVVVIPSNFDLQFNATANKINFDGLAIDNLKGNMKIKQGKLELRKSGFDLIGSNVLMDLVYGSQSTEKAFFDFKVDAKEFDIKRAYNEIKMFREMASAAESAEGIVSLDYKVAGILDGNMSPIYPSLTGGGTLSVKNVKMKGFKMFGTVSKKTGKDAMANPDVSKVDINTKIKNNIITIERFKFKVAGFRPRIEGQSSFDGKLNIKMRLGLPPFGLIGIPLKITGTQDNPIVKMGKETQDLEETEYEGDVPQPLSTEPKPQ